MIEIFKKTEFIEYEDYKRLIDKMDDLYFMSHFVKKKMEIWFNQKEMLNYPYYWFPLIKQMLF